MEYIAVVTAMIQWMAGNKAGRASESAALKEAAAEGRVTGEKLRQLKVEERVLAGQTRAGAAGSGVKANVGSPLEILAEQAREFQRERAVVADVGATKAAAALQRGSNVASLARYQGFSQAVSSIGNAFMFAARDRSG